MITNETTINQSCDFSFAYYTKHSLPARVNASCNNIDLFIRIKNKNTITVQMIVYTKVTKFCERKRKLVMFTNEITPTENKKTIK